MKFRPVTALASAGLAIATLSVIPTASAQDTASGTGNAVKTMTAEQIHARHIEAIGGTDSMAKVRSVITRGSIDIPMIGMKGTVEVFEEMPSKQKNVTTLPQVGEQIQCLDGDSGWTKQPMAGRADANFG